MQKDCFFIFYEDCIEQLAKTKSKQSSSGVLKGCEYTHEPDVGSTIEGSAIFDCVRMPFFQDQKGGHFFDYFKW